MNNPIINAPISRVSTYKFETLEDVFSSEEKEFGSFTYGRISNITNNFFEEKISELENAYKSIVFPSGLAAITSTILAYAKSGSHILIPDDVYSGVNRFCEHLQKFYEISVDRYSTKPGEFDENLLRENTSLIYIEIPSYTFLNIVDIEKLMISAKKISAKVVVDSTWGTPLYIRPLEIGVDVVIHSVSKYIAGHSDILLGVAACTKDSWSTIKQSAILLGEYASPDDSYLAIRGLKTFKTRMNLIEKSAYHVANYLESHSLVAGVNYPALPSSVNYKLWRKYFRGASGRFSITLTDVPKRGLSLMLNQLTLFSLGYGWGGCDSLIIPKNLEKNDNENFEVVVLLLSIGLEDVNYLIADLEAGLIRCYE